MGKKSGPEADPRIAEAALESAATGRDYLDWMKDQASVTNGWADEDRTRYKEVFEPLQDQYIDDAQGWDSDARKDARVGQVQADVSQNIANANGQRRRQLSAMGVDPTSGRYAEAEAGASINEGLATAGAGNMARRSVEAEGEMKRINAINMGSGLAVNPGTSMGLANGAASAGFSGAMQGIGQGGQLLQQDYQNRVQQWQNQQAGVGQLFGALGSVAGLAFGSSKEIKKDKRPVRSVLKAVENMPVEKWTYKKGAEDEGTHIGPYAEDFARETGVGDGKQINAQDAIGVTMAAVKELSEKVTQLGKMRSVMA